MGLLSKKCLPCEGEIPKLTPDQIQGLLPQIPSWELADRILRRRLSAKNFMAAIDYFNKIAVLAESEGHHPDLHLEGYRKVTIEIWTHAVGGLTENDFILAVKIDQLPVELKA